MYIWNYEQWMKSVGIILSVLLRLLENNARKLNYYEIEFVYIGNMWQVKFTVKIIVSYLHVKNI